MPSLFYDRYYRYSGESIIKCGECWDEDIRDTLAGRLTGDEAVRMNDLELLSEKDPYQCDGCMKQSDNYDTEI